MLQKPVAINIVEVKAPELDAQLTAESSAQQLEKRSSFRRAMKQSIGNAMRRGAKGIKIMCSGRLGGAEIARSEQYHEGTIPLQTLLQEFAKLITFVAYGADSDNGRFRILSAQNGGDRTENQAHAVLRGNRTARFIADFILHNPFPRMFCYHADIAFQNFLFRKHIVAFLHLATAPVARAFPRAA